MWVTQSSQHPVQLHRITDEWEQETITWANSALDIDPLASATFIPNISEQFVKSDLTNLVQEWANGSQPNHGIMLLGSQDESIYTSKNWYLPQQRPHLQIEYTLGDADNQIFLPLMLRK